MPGQKPGRTIRGLAKRVGEGVRNSTLLLGSQSWGVHLRANMWRIYIEIECKLLKHVFQHTPHRFDLRVWSTYRSNYMFPGSLRNGDINI